MSGRGVGLTTRGLAFLCVGLAVAVGGVAVGHRDVVWAGAFLVAVPLLGLALVSLGRRVRPSVRTLSPVELPAGEVLTTGIVTKGQRAILEAMALEVFAEAGATARQLMATVGMPEPSLYRALSKLKRGEYLSQGVKGDPYRITERGTRLLDTSLGL